MEQSANIQKLKYLAVKMRLHIVRMMGVNKAHHFGGSLSATDLVTALYFYKMKFDPTNLQLPERDRFVLSKGHCVPVQYVALAMSGIIPLEELSSLKKMGSRLQGHPAMHYIPGIEACTGALGEGLSYANGLAWAARLKKLEYHVYCLLGDGELQEGQVWEAAMTTVKQKFSNVTAIIDKNHFKAMDETSSSKILEPLVERWLNFGWEVKEINGHNMTEICNALDWVDMKKGKPSVIIADTIKGKGISFIENQPSFHNAALTEEQFQRAIPELEKELNSLREDIDQ